MIGFGTSNIIYSTLGSITICGTGMTGINNFSFNMPRDGTITALSASFSLTEVYNPRTLDLDIWASIFISDPPSDFLFKIWVLIWKFGHIHLVQLEQLEFNIIPFFIIKPLYLFLLMKMQE